MQHVGKPHVVYEATTPAEQRRIFHPRDARTELFRAHALASLLRAQTACRFERRRHDAGVTGTTA